MAVERVHAFARGNREDEVAVEELGVELGDDCSLVAGDGDHAELLEFFRRRVLDEFEELEVQDGGVLGQLEDGDLQAAAREIHGLGRGVVLEESDDFVGGALLGIEHQLDAQFLEYELVLCIEIVFVVDARDHLGGAELLGEQRAHDVDLLRGQRIHGDEQVGLVHGRGAQDLDRRRVAENRLHIGVGRQGRDARGVVVDDRDFVRFGAKHFCEVGTDLTGSLNDYLHSVSHI